MTTETATRPETALPHDITTEPANLTTRPAPRRQDVVSAQPAAPHSDAPAFLECSVELSDLLQALVQATLAFTAIEADRIANIRSDKGNYTYGWASISEINRAVRKPLAENGLVVVHGARPSGGGNRGDTLMTIRTTLFHAPSGQWMRNDLPVAIFGGDPREIGKGMTYARRYNMLALLNLAPGEDEDDDGEQGEVEARKVNAPQAATRKSQQTQPQAQAEAKPKADPPPSNIGLIVGIEPKGANWMVALDSGYKAGTKNAELAGALIKHKSDGKRVELTCKAPRDPKFAPAIEEIRVIETTPVSEA